MSHIEIFIALLLLLAVPDFCKKLVCPALVFPVFEVGLEIDLPPLRDLKKPFRYALFWTLAQYPFILALASFLGLRPAEAILAAAALTGCSVGMAYPAWSIIPDWRVTRGRSRCESWCCWKRRRSLRLPRNQRR